MIKEKSWEEFRDNGMLWFVNSILHLFGYAICYEYKDGKIARVYPARVKFRGFSEKINTSNYESLSKYMKDNSCELYEESKER